MNASKLMMLCVSLVAALAATGCGGGAYRGPDAPAPTPMQPESFTDFSKSMIGTSEMNMPVNVDAVVFNFDGDDNPTAYADLFPAS